MASIVFVINRSRSRARLRLTRYRPGVSIGGMRHGVYTAPGCLLAGAIAALLCAGCGNESGAKDSSSIVLVVTPPETRAPLVFKGAAAVAAEYALPGTESRAAQSNKNSGLSASETFVVVRHLILPDSPSADKRKAILEAALLSAVKDKLVRALLVAPASEGTVDAFRAVRSRRKDISLVAFEPSEERLAVEAAADLVVEVDRLYRPYYAVQSAKKAGAKRFVEAASGSPVSLSRARESAILKAACTEFGLAYRSAKAAPNSKGYGWLGDIGPDCALYCAEPSVAPFITEAALATGALVVDGGPDSLEVWVNALAAGLPADFKKLNPEARLKHIEKAAVGVTGAGRIAVWTTGYGSESVEALGGFLYMCVRGTAKLDDSKALVSALRTRFPGSAWIASFDADPVTGVKAGNHLLLRQDPYVFGYGYQQSAFFSMPPSYLTIKASAP